MQQVAYDNDGSYELLLANTVYYLIKRLQLLQEGRKRLEFQAKQHPKNHVHLIRTHRRTRMVIQCKLGSNFKPASNAHGRKSKYLLATIHLQIPGKCDNAMVVHRSKTASKTSYLVFDLILIDRI